MSNLFEKLTENSYLPKKGTAESAGFDLRSPVSRTIKAHSLVTIFLDIVVNCPRETFGKIYERSGMARNSQIIVLGGVIDADYRGNVGVMLFNLGDKDFNIAKGDRIAQIVFHKIFNGVGNCFVLKEERGNGGFGSTDDNNSKKRKVEDDDDNCSNSLMI